MFNCELCRDCGYIGGFSEPFKWCGCPMAKQVQEEKPTLVADANNERIELIGRFQGSK